MKNKILIQTKDFIEQKSEPQKNSNIARPNSTKKIEEFLVFGAPKIGKAEINAVVAVMRSGWLGTGARVSRFEQQFSIYKGGGFAVALNSCTAALHLSLLTLKLKPGDEVITTPLTFCATVNAIIHAGGTPVLADVDKESMNISPAAIEEKVTSKTRAILPVHFAGRPCDMEKIMKIAKKHDLVVIEDCAHAIESKLEGKHVGTFGDFGCFSFYVTKNVVTGEGGMVLTNNQDSATQIKVLGLHGMSKDAWKRFGSDGYNHYQVVAAGFKYNMIDLQAAIGIEQLNKVHENWIKRKKIWDTYQKGFLSVPIQTPADPGANMVHAYHLYTIRINKRNSGITRDEFLAEMTRNRIGVGVHYQSIPEHPYYNETYKWCPEDFPNAMQIGRETVSLPISPKLSQQQVSNVLKTVKNIIKC